MESNMLLPVSTHKDRPTGTIEITLSNNTTLTQMPQAQLVITICLTCLSLSWKAWEDSIGQKPKAISVLENANGLEEKQMDLVPWMLNQPSIHPLEIITLSPTFLLTVDNPKLLETTLMSLIQMLQVHHPVVEEETNLATHTLKSALSLHQMEEEVTTLHLAIQRMNLAHVL